MTIQIGQPVPDAQLQYIDDGIKQITTRELFDAGDVVLFGVPGAFTPTCSERHLPSYIEHFDAFRARGIRVACLSVNDPFVMQAWGEQLRVPEGLLMLGDGNAEFTRALGLELDASAYGMGTRCKRFSLLAKDGLVRQLHVEAPGEYRISSAEHLLSELS